MKRHRETRAAALSLAPSAELHDAYSNRTVARHRPRGVPAAGLRRAGCV